MIALCTKYYTKTNVPPPMWVLLLTLLPSWTLGTGYWLVTCPPLFQDEGVRGGEREERPPDPRARQEEQPLGGEGEVRHHVDRLTSDFCTRDLVCFLLTRCCVCCPRHCPGQGPTTPHPQLTAHMIKGSLLWPGPSLRRFIHRRLKYARLSTNKLLHMFYCKAVIKNLS